MSKFFLDQTLKRWLTGKIEGKMKIQKFEYLKSEKSFLDEIKTIFIIKVWDNFWKLEAL